MTSAVFGNTARQAKKAEQEFGSKCKSDFSECKKGLDLLLPKLAKHEVEELRSLIHKHYVKRFKRNRIPKYGNLDKGFTERELGLFFRAIDSEKFRLLFSFQAQLGLRIGEAVSVNVKDVDFETRELTVKTEKAQVIDTLLIPLPLFKQTVEFINRNSSAIEESGGFIFFKEWYSHSKLKHLDMNYVRGRFRRYVVKAGLDESYDISDESKGRSVRRLHRLTTHSLRHYAITSFSRQTNGNVVLTSRFARHANPNTTMTYISTRKEELYREIDNTFGLSQAVGLKTRLSKPV
jgi:integrase